jgi:hypothetical protein
MIWTIIVVAAFAGAFGYALGGRSKRLSRPEIKELAQYKARESRVYRLAAQHASTESFAIIVMDEIDKDRNLE